MTIYEFTCLDETEQAQALSKGVIVGGRDENGDKILLYQLDSFYVEVYYNSEFNFIKNFRPFSSTQQLQPYLEKIDLSSL